MQKENTIIEMPNVELVDYTIPELVQYVEELLMASDLLAVQELFEELLPFDMFSIYDLLSVENHQKLIDALSAEALGAIFTEYDAYAAYEHLKECSTRQAALILEAMNSDDAVQVFKIMDRSVVIDYLSYMSRERVKEIQQLLFYDDDSAGSIMAFGMLTVAEDDNIKTAMHKVIAAAPHAETVNVVYVTTAEQVLTGVLSLRDLLVARKEEIVRDVMSERVISIQVDENRNIASQLMQDYDLTVLPVVNAMDVLEGIITIDDVVDVMREEAEEDYYKMAGISEEDNSAVTSDYELLPSMKKRLPWLVSMILLSILVSTVIGAYQNSFAAEIIVVLTPFITMVNNMTGVPGIQVAAVTMLRVVSGEINNDKKLLKKFVINQTVTALIIGVIIGLVVASCAYILTVLLGNGNFTVFIIVSIAVFISSVISSLIGIFSVLILDKLGKDPAVASGPFMSTVGDMIGVIIYFTVAMGIYSLIG